MALKFFNGADASDVESFEAMRADAADDTSAVRAVWRRARGLKRFSEEIAFQGGPDLLKWHDYDLNGTCANYLQSRCGFSVVMPCNVLNSPLAWCCMHINLAIRPEHEERVVLTEKRLYWLQREPTTYKTIGVEVRSIPGALVWVSIDVTSLSDARRATPWCFCCGGHDGFVVRVDDETPKIHNHIINSAGFLFSPHAKNGVHTVPVIKSKVPGGGVINSWNVALAEKYPEQACFRFSSSSPNDAVAVLAEVMGAAKPQVMTRA
jgi:hypothetical protein